MLESIYTYTWIIPFMPSLTAGILGFFLICTKRLINTQRWMTAIISIMTVLFIMFFSIILFYLQITQHFSHLYLWSWLHFDELWLQIGYIIDPISTLMLIVVTTVSLCVMLYTHGYMKYDQGYVRFFVYLGLFIASMLGLILSPNLVQIYIFWELVGVCSYLLVGFWFTRPSAAYACQKAFVINRIGDFGLLLGILGIYWLTGSLEFDMITVKASQILSQNHATSTLFLCFSICLFFGPIAKSAQFPLHIWLPDAMEGPTPISALIHAATMVAAGVFLVARLLPLFELIPLTMDIIACTGAITALLGASIALFQKDLKKGLAYSTMSQLGYMILALGIGSYQSALFHLITHAYSKALLFLGSGSVIHSVETVVGYNPNKCQNMLYMGGLRRCMPITGTTFLIGTLSLCGIPPFACFWSKDEILSESWQKFPLLGFSAWLTAGLTAFYMFRIYLLTFEGEFRGFSSDNHENTKLVLHLNNFSTSSFHYPHESNWSMTLPLLILTIPTLFVGFLGVPLSISSDTSINTDYLSQLLWINVSDKYPANALFHLFLDSLPSVFISSIGFLLAWNFYGPHLKRFETTNNWQIDPSFQGRIQYFLDSLYSWSLRRGYIDEIYDKTFLLLTHKLALFLAFLDQWLIDGLVNLSGLIFLFGGESLKYTEGGKIASYFFLFVLSLIFFLITYVDMLNYIFK
jgi:NAD(P)H-quinone oxidoreductase subunit 5